MILIMKSLLTEPMTSLLVGHGDKSQISANRRKE